jgi:hypothetical protein
MQNSCVRFFGGNSMGNIDMALIPVMLALLFFVMMMIPILLGRIACRKELIP